jgi:DNA-binding transcriptional ArsR family regulator
MYARTNMHDVALRRAVRAPARQLLERVEAHVGEAAALLKALANEQRLLVLCTLVDGPRTVGEINERVMLSQSALSQHLAVLRTAGIVVTRREAQTIHYAVAPGPANEILQALYERFCAPRGAPSRRRRGASARTRSNPRESGQ